MLKIESEASSGSQWKLIYPVLPLASASGGTAFFSVSFLI